MSAVLKTKKREEIYYPESDGKPMGETDFHIQTITYLYQALNAFFSNEPDVKICADIMFYYEEGNPHKVFSPDVMFVRGVANIRAAHINSGKKNNFRRSFSRFHHGRRGAKI